MANRVEEILEALHQHKNVLLYGPPGTGKSHLMNEVARLFTAEKVNSDAAVAVFLDTGEERVPLKEGSPTPPAASRWVTFHQGYSYEDFILGVRPQSSSGGLFSLIPRAGVLLELAAEAESSAGLLLIDEINRGNTSRIFGEFITLMEPAKRLAEDGSLTPNTITLTLPYLAPGDVVEVVKASGDTFKINRQFAMPSRVYTLASMNSVDKSIAPLDTALRRRFHIINIFPSGAELRLAVGLKVDDPVDLAPLGTISDNEGLARLAVRVLEKLNRGIGLYLGHDFMLGQWYLQSVHANLPAFAPHVLAETWLYRIVPQLMELFHGRTGLLIALLRLDSNEKGSGLSVFQPDEDEADSGALAYVTTVEPLPQRDEVIAFLQRLVDAPEPAVVPN